jgi:EAL domain-containing protein (putative c-di-GMP-specific phosphodiesterase class I)
VLSAACRQARLWRDSELAGITMAINLSARQIEHPQFVEKFTHCLQKPCRTGKGSKSRSPRAP